MISISQSIDYRLEKAAVYTSALWSISASSVVNCSAKNLLVQSHPLLDDVFDTWKITAKVAPKINVFQQQCLLHAVYEHHIAN